jgi:hypothetical protein
MILANPATFARGSTSPHPRGTSPFALRCSICGDTAQWHYFGTLVVTLAPTAMASGEA